MAPLTVDGLNNIPSKYSVEETLNRLRSVLEAKGLTIFGDVDHSGEARRAGLSMRPTHVLLFGNPKAGTPLMQAAPTLAIDLPLKALIREDENGRVWVSYNTPEYLRRRHGVPDEMVNALSAVIPLLDWATGGSGPELNQTVSAP